MAKRNWVILSFLGITFRIERIIYGINHLIIYRTIMQSKFYAIVICSIMHMYLISVYGLIIGFYDLYGEFSIFLEVFFCKYLFMKIQLQYIIFNFWYHIYYDTFFTLYIISYLIYYFIFGFNWPFWSWVFNFFNVLILIPILWYDLWYNLWF